MPIPEQLADIVGFGRVGGIGTRGRALWLTRARSGAAVDDKVLLMLNRQLTPTGDSGPREEELPGADQQLAVLAAQAVRSVAAADRFETPPHDPNTILELQLAGRPVSWHDVLYIASYREGRTWPEEFGSKNLIPPNSSSMIDLG